MKKCLAIIMTLMAAMACQKVFDEPEAAEAKFTASAESYDETKTFTDESLQVKWSKGDYLNVWEHKRASDKYTITAASVGLNDADLEIVESGSSSGFVAKLSANIGYYPYAEDIACSADGDGFKLKNIVLPASQTYAAGSFGNGSLPMVAVSSGEDDYDLAFRNVCGVLRIVLTGDMLVKTVSVTGNNDEILCGSAEVSASNTSLPSITMTGDGKTVTLDCGDGVQVGASATSFDIVLPPVTFEKGFTISVNGKDYFTTARQQTIKRSRILCMGSKIAVSNDYLKFTSDGETAITLAKNGSPDNITLLYFKESDCEWKSYTIGESISLSDGESVFFKAGEGGNATFSKDGSNFYIFRIKGDGTVKASGNIMSLLDPNCESVTCPESCFRSLFSRCTSLTSAPDLPATSLASYCYYWMFFGCTGLTAAPELPALTMADYCYDRMFDDCTSLTAAPELPATTLADYCYHLMFSGCTGLTEAPALPATTLTEWCYAMMFEGCTGLTAAPELPATDISGGCYTMMFYGCTGLTSAPALPATTLFSCCYWYMFSGCTGLTSAPELPATTLVDRCYVGMFYGCSNLGYIKMLADEVPSTDYMTNWTDGVCSTGTFVKSAASTWDVRGTSGIPDGWEVKTASTDYLKFTSEGTTIISLTKTGSPVDVTLMCLKESEGGWKKYTIGDGIGLSDGESVFFKAGEGGNAGFSSDSQNCYKFSMTGSGKVKASGNIMSLLDAECASLVCPACCFWSLFRDCTGLTSAPALPATTLADYCYYGMFRGCTGLTSAPVLPATALAESCYSYMFHGCSSMTSAPELPAATLASRCYSSMFYGCTGLTSAPALPATTLADYCYYGMFRGCTGLMSAPVLPATTLAESCYGYMYYGCTSLTSAPELPATTLASYCYSSMFRGCTGLTSVPALPAMALADYCYDGMFRGCTGLTSAPALPATALAEHCYSYMFGSCSSLTSAPALPATTLAAYCYDCMFGGCTSLPSAPALPATNLAEYCYYYMFEECTGLTSAPALPATTLTKGCYGIMFYGCTGLTSAPSLPATTLANGCYGHMFYGCTGLTSAPSLPATTLTDNCYQYMFGGCSQLSYIKMLATDISATSCLDCWTNGVSSTGTFVKNSAATWNIYGINGIPSGWTIETE